MGQQFRYFIEDIRSMLGKHKVRILHIWLSRAFCGIFVYRLERSLHLLIGSNYKIIRVILIPIYNLLYAYSNIEINYNADIKGGISILHPSAGIVISRFSSIGRNLTLTGGNIIGSNPGATLGDIQIGNNCYLGANAVIIGPIKLGNDITVAALACVVKDCEENNMVLRGVPAAAHSRE